MLMQVIFIYFSIVDFQKNILTFSFNDEKLGKRTLPFARALTSYINTY